MTVEHATAQLGSSSEFTASSLLHMTGRLHSTTCSKGLHSSSSTQQQQQQRSNKQQPSQAHLSP